MADEKDDKEINIKCHAINNEIEVLMAKHGLYYVGVWASKDGSACIVEDTLGATGHIVQLLYHLLARDPQFAECFKMAAAEIASGITADCRTIFKEEERPGEDKKPH